jgi:hypothetical protein
LKQKERTPPTVTIPAVHGVNPRLTSTPSTKYTGRRSILELICRITPQGNEEDGSATATQEKNFILNLLLSVDFIFILLTFLRPVDGNSQAVTQKVKFLRATKWSVPSKK